ncbi:hypothetical protein JOE57_002844 [Microlunatus panaciterrae]|uniref:Uncharacterized protein n=1 Tax=Microlunatus panaciterrae TaxID=400768 RepID=A0ABS2RML7_9ACTN|nr:hypothetical protein [Microlunatus panaciterrae]MBM7799923.1 hypothetical protein [Microlunatus panaciterrae]
MKGTRRPLLWSWTTCLLLIAVVFIGLRAVHDTRPHPQSTAITTSKVVVVGGKGGYQLTDAERTVLNAHAATAEAGAVSVRPRYIGDCAAAGWSTLGAGRRTAVGGLCTPQVEDQHVVEWQRRLAAAAAHNGDARLGTLAELVPGCVAAVGPGAALAAARSDGSLARYQTVQEFIDADLATPCPITLVDPGEESDAIITTLARRSDVSLIVTGVGPPSDSHDSRLQALYLLRSSPAGWLTSASTRRDGVVNLTDLTRVLVDFGRRGAPPVTAPIDGSPLMVRVAPVTADALHGHLAAVTALSAAALRGQIALGIGGAVLMVILVVSLMVRRFDVSRVIVSFGCILPAAMMLTGAVRWQDTSSPGLVLSLLVAGWAVVLTALVLVVARRNDLAVAGVGAAVVVTAFTVDAALGAVMQPGSMLNSRPTNGGRWYGFGNVTFAVYSSAALLLAGYLAHRLRAAGHRISALGAVALVGFGTVLCMGWPSMGADFGGVLALTPGVLWLLLALTDLPVTWRKLAGIGLVGLLAVVVISWLDWRRGPDARSHLGNFVQRVIDGDAADIVIRKAAAAAESLVAPMGVISLIIGIALWILIFRRLLGPLSTDLSTIRPIAVAALMTAVLGTLVNDGGSSVWLTLTAAFTVSVWALWIDRAYRARRRDQAEARSLAGASEARA